MLPFQLALLFLLSLHLFILSLAVHFFFLKDLMHTKDYLLDVVFYLSGVAIYPSLLPQAPGAEYPEHQLPGRYVHRPLAHACDPLTFR